MFGFDLWKKSFDVWVNATADILEQWMRSPLILGPSGALLSAVMKSKAASDKVARFWWGSLGLPTKREQERTLHALNQLESRLLDLEEKLDGLKRS
jgi:hypothetical protein